MSYFTSVVLSIKVVIFCFTGVVLSIEVLILYMERHVHPRTVVSVS
jgi:hypothetical protein